MGQDADTQFKVEFKGQVFAVNERKFLFIQRLENAIASAIRGQTATGGVVEISTTGKSRGFYFVESDDQYDSLITQWDDFRKFVERDMVKFQGNAPTANRSLAKN